MGEPKVIAVVLTRDRRELLRESLGAVQSQTRRTDELVVVDNASSDGTAEMLEGDFGDAVVVRLPENQGATGGFCEGISAAAGLGADWLWLLDDDTVPRASALAELLDGAARAPGNGAPAMLASRVEWRDGEPHPMNRPTIRRRDPQLLLDAVREGLLPLRATTWVSLLLSREAVEREEMPRRHFFYQADDIEYTARVLRRSTGFFVPTSVVEHRTATKQTWTSDERRFYHHARNNVFMLRGEAWERSEKPALAWALAGSALEYLRLNGFSMESARTLVQGLVAGLRPPGS